MNSEDSDSFNIDKYEEFVKIADDYRPYVSLSKRKSVNTTQLNLPLEKAIKQNEQNETTCIKFEENEINEKDIKINEIKEETLLIKPKNWKCKLKTSWCPPSYINELSENQIASIRLKFNISVIGNNVPCPLASFKEMKLNKTLIRSLRNKNIKSPTSFQMQALPIVLSGRDMIGVAPTGSGKTLVNIIPLLMFALEQETSLPFKKGEGPYGLILVPSRDLARQIFDNIEYFSSKLVEKSFAAIRTVLCIGGVAMREQIMELKKGCHIVVATPGRLVDLVKKLTLNFDVCRMVCIDDGDRMLDAGFEQELGNIYEHIKYQTQTIILGSAMPRHVSEMIKSVLVDPITVVAGRIGTQNLNIIQEIELVSEESRLTYLLKCVKKTPPPILVFAYRKGDIEKINEYLIFKEVECVSIHGDTSYDEKNILLNTFKSGKVPVMVATDIASKGVDFPSVKHVINFDTPADIETYIHRISKTGRSGRTGLATTFLTKSCDENFLTELRNVLIESKQKIPQFLMDLKFDSTYTELKYHCTNCGPSNHSISGCPRFDSKSTRPPTTH